MSLPVYPTIPGIEQRLAIAPIWDTIVQRAASGRTVRVANMAEPQHQITITYTLLTAAAPALQFQQLIQFYDLVGGRAGLWQYVSSYISRNTTTGVYSYSPNPANTTTILTCAFDQDRIEFETECYGLWMVKTLSFTTVKT